MDKQTKIVKIMDGLFKRNDLEKQVIINIAKTMIDLLINIENDIKANSTTTKINNLQKYIESGTYIKTIMEKCCSDKANFLKILDNEKQVFINSFRTLIKLMD